ncbi:FUSC family protein [Tunturibacter empetritectus]|uniref:FUSC family protein n=1 Tax=Tunturiibacter empetritectus TaxID=3069691 RepID=A0AAU7ZE31_9BACT
MVETSFFGTISSLGRKLWEDLQPTPGRLNSSLRIVLATIIALILMLVWQMPSIYIGMYFIFLIGRDSPAISFRTGLISLLTVVAAIAVELAVVILSDNDPMARVLSVAVVTFIAGVLVASTNFPVLGSTWGLIFCTVIGNWEKHAPADRLVKGSLWLIATLAVAIGVSVLVEYLFGDRDPAKKLEAQRKIRYQALEKMFTAYAQGGTPEQRYAAAIPVSRLAIAGSTGMLELYNKIAERDLDTGTLPPGTRLRVTMLAQIMNVSAAFGLQNTGKDSPELRRRCGIIAEQCRELIPVFVPTIEKRLRFMPENSVTLLDRVEAALHALLTMPSDAAEMGNKELVAMPVRKAPFFIPDAVGRNDTLAFGLKISLCATLCYVLYNAVNWPGISTAVITVVVTGLSSSGAIKQKLFFRVLGSIVGGLILGLGAISLLFPHMDSITSLVILIGSVAFISAWTAAAPRFNYVGLQIAFSFYLVAFEDFSAPTELAPARDHLIGVLLALLVMWFVFDQIWPVRTVTVMRQSLAGVLKSVASFLRLIEPHHVQKDLLQQADALRDQVGKTVIALRSMNDAVDYEFGVDRELHVRSSLMILRTSLTAGTLFWNQLAVLYSERDKDFLTEPDLIEMRRRLAESIDELAEGVVKKTLPVTAPATALIPPAMLNDPRYGEYSRNTIARFEELQAFARMLSHEV